MSVVCQVCFDWRVHSKKMRDLLSEKLQLKSTSLMAAKKHRTRLPHDLKLLKFKITNCYYCFSAVLFSDQQDMRWSKFSRTE